MARQITPSGWPYYQAANDEPNGAEQQQDLAETLEAQAVKRQLGTRAARTASPAAPLLHAATDTNTVSFWNGTKWIEPQLLLPVVKTADFTFTIDHAGNVIVETNSSDPIVATIPTNATVPFPVGAVMNVERIGAGAVTIAAAAGVTIRSDNDQRSIRTRYDGVQIRQRAVDEWVLIGALT